MRIQRQFALTALVTAVSVGVPGCGSDNSADEDAITEVIEYATTSGDPAVCTDAQTQAFTDQTNEGSGTAAIKSCERDAKDTPADEVEVSNIEVDGGSATAEIAVTGGSFDGQTLGVGLVKDGDEWKLDEFREFVGGMDRDAFVNAIDIPESARDCVGKNLDALSDEEVDSIFIDENSKLEGQAFGPCFGK